MTDQLATSAPATGATGAAPAAAGEAAPSSAAPPASYLFDLQGEAPDTTSVPGGVVRRANQAHFPILRGLALFSLQLEVGAMRAPHLHTNAAELDYLVCGTAQVGMVDATGATITFEMTAGQIAFYPQAWAHWLVNTGDEPLQAIFAYTNEQPVTVEVAAIDAAIAGLRG